MKVEDLKLEARSRRNQRSGVAYLCYAYAGSVCAIHYHDEGIRTSVVCGPRWSQICLPAQVPHLKLEVLVPYLLHIAASSGLSDDSFSKVEFVEGSCLSCVVQANLQGRCAALYFRSCPFLKELHSSLPAHLQVVQPD